MMNGIIKENPIFVLLLGMSYTGYDIIGNQRYGYGTGHYVRPDLLERGNFIY